MLIMSIICFILAAALGAFLLSYVLTDKNTPKGVAILHGSFAVAGLVLLIISAFYYPILTICILIFGLAAIGGLITFGIDLSGKKIPKALALGHGLVALTGFIVLLYIFLVKM